MLAGRGKHFHTSMRRPDVSGMEVKMSKKPIVLMILDGYGLNDKTEGNDKPQARTPVME